MSADYLCPHCQEPTEDLAKHVEADEMTGEPIYPVRYLTGWSENPSCSHIHARRFERESEGRGRFSSKTEYRYGVVCDRICWPCNTAMPHSVCEYRS